MKKRRDNNYQNIESIISTGVEIKGEINSKGSIRIDGNVEGKINVQGDVILGEKGHIKGEIKAENMILAGKVEGNINTKGRLEISSTGVLLGDIMCSVLTIEEGGILDGNTKMAKTSEKSDTGKSDKRAK